MTKSHVELKVVEEDKTKIAQILELCGIPAALHAPAKVRLRLWQQLVSLCNVLITHAGAKLQISEAAVGQFWQEIKRLEDAGYHQVLGHKTIEEFEGAFLMQLAKKVETFFAQPTYYVGRSQRYAVPVFKGLPWKVQTELLAHALQKSSPHSRLQAVGENAHHARSTVTVMYTPEFEEHYDAARAAAHRPLLGASIYVLCGVNGGRDTHEFTTSESITYFHQSHRLSLTLKEALTLYTLHPDFLDGKNSAVILLGEECNGKYVTLSFNAVERVLAIGLSSLEEADMVHRPSNPHPNRFTEGLPRISYGKPSAGAVILP